VTASAVERLVRAFFDEALNAHSLEALPRFCGAGYVYHANSDGHGDTVGLDAFAGAVATYFEAFPDIHATVLDVIAMDDRAAVRLFETGTHQGPFTGVAATHRRMRWDTIAIYRAENGLLVEEWSVGDNLSLLRQLGAIVPAAGATL
jgi:predicted ester cyclase